MCQNYQDWLHKSRETAERFVQNKSYNKIKNIAVIECGRILILVTINATTCNSEYAVNSQGIVIM